MLPLNVAIHRFRRFLSGTILWCILDIQFSASIGKLGLTGAFENILLLDVL